jgi:hypothetical protein
MRTLGQLPEVNRAADAVKAIGIVTSNVFAQAEWLSSKRSPTFSGPRKAQLPQAFAQQAGVWRAERSGELLSERRFVSGA